MIELETYIDGRFVHHQRSDGLIVSTPTGTTAYALSAGGPIIYPTLNAVAIVPICPHTMSNRPIVVDGDSQIEIFVVDNNSDNVRITCDGQVPFQLISGDHIEIRKAKKPLRLIHPSSHDHYDMLRVKLQWAEPPKGNH
jgi:NAD+ kinase